MILGEITTFVDVSRDTKECSPAHIVSRICGEVDRGWICDAGMMCFLQFVISLVGPEFSAAVVDALWVHEARRKNWIGLKMFPEFAGKYDIIYIPVIDAGHW